MTAEKRLNEHHAPTEVWVTHHALDTYEPENQWLDQVDTKPWAADYKAQITEWAAQTRYVRADLTAVPAQVRVKPLDTPAAHELKLRAGIPNLPTQLTYDCRIAIAGEGPRWYDWTDKPHRLVYDLCREIEAIAAIEPQPDPRDEVIARLVEAFIRRMTGPEIAALKKLDDDMNGPHRGEAMHWSVRQRLSDDGLICIDGGVSSTLGGGTIANWTLGLTPLGETIRAALPAAKAVQK